MATTLYIDADGCPVKEEAYKVAARYGLAVRVVASRQIHVPPSPLRQAVAAGDAFDAADDWIVAHAGPGDVVVTADILLAARCLERGARVLSPRGRAYTEETIGDAVAARALAQHLRESGLDGGGPPPMDKRARSRFLSTLDEMINAIRREGR